MKNQARLLNIGPNFKTACVTNCPLRVSVALILALTVLVSTRHPISEILRVVWIKIVVIQGGFYIFLHT